MTKTLGPNFGNEVIAAGLGGLPISWGETDADMNVADLTDAQRSILASIIAAHDPTKPVTITEVLSQDLMAQFNAADAAKIQTAVATNPQFWLLWSALQAQKDPMDVGNARFMAGWSALVAVLGADRMTVIAAALGVTVI